MFIFEEARRRLLQLMYSYYICSAPFENLSTRRACSFQFTVPKARLVCAQYNCTELHLAVVGDFPSIVIAHSLQGIDWAWQGFVLLVRTFQVILVFIPLTKVASCIVRNSCFHDTVGLSHDRVIFEINFFFPAQQIIFL